MGDTENTGSADSQGTDTAVGDDTTQDSTFGDYPDLSSQQDSGTADQDSQDNSGGHPAWDEYLKDIPEVFHPQVKPAFEKWDKNFQKVQSEYEPYKEFIGTDPNELQAALQVANLIRTNPKALYDNLGSRYGFNSNFDQGQSDEEDDSEDEYGYEYESEEESSIEDDPRFQELANKYAEMAQYIQRQQQEQQEQQQMAQVKQETEQAFSEIEKGLGRTLNDNERAEIVQRTVMLGDRNGGNYDIREGYKDFAQFVNTVRSQPRANDSAPDVLSGNGGLPVKSQDMSLDEKFEHWANQIAAGNKNS